MDLIVILARVVMAAIYTLLIRISGVRGSAEVDYPVNVHALPNAPEKTTTDNFTKKADVFVDGIDHIK